MSVGETGLQLRQPFGAGFAAQADTDQAYRAMIDTGTAFAWTPLMPPSTLGLMSAT